jgi:hypothetical protein
MADIRPGYGVPATGTGPLQGLIDSPAFSCAGVSLMARTKQRPPNSSSTRGQRLRNISAALTAWGKFYGPGVEKAARRSDEAKYAARTAMTLMLADLALLNECRAGYGCRHDLEIAFNCLADAATWPSDRDNGDCPKWGEEFTQPKLWDGQKRSFINEVNRWANSVDEEQIRSRYRPDEPGRSLAMKVPSVDSANGAADTPADLAKDIVDILESGGPHLHVKDHDAPPETRYDERTMRILLGSYLKRYNGLRRSYRYLPPPRISADPFMSLAELQALCMTPADGEFENRSARQGNKRLGLLPKATWKPPKGYINATGILNEYGVPRATLQSWQARDDVPGGPLEGKLKRAPGATHELYYPEAWVKKRVQNWQPSPRRRHKRT